MAENNVIPLGGFSKRMTELEACQVRIRIMAAYLDEKVPGWRDDIQQRLEKAL